MNLRLADPGILIDIGRVAEWKGIDVLSDGTIRIGALTTHAEIARSPLVPAVMVDAAGIIGDPQVRNRGTIGGNLAHADPASDWPAVVTALDATLELVSPRDTRPVRAREFFVGLFETALDDDELLAAVLIPPLASEIGSAYAKLPHPASRYTLVSAAALVAIRDGQFQKPAVALGGLAPRPTRARSVEAALVGRPATRETIASAAAAVQQDLEDDLAGDLYASADYRRAMAEVFVRRALTAAAERAG
jgi:carbon-monoxide dehydrogenase medium subunit